MQFTKTQYISVYTLVLCAALLLIFPPTASPQTVNIPDANLREAIAEALGKAPNARITKNEMARLTTRLDANNRGIKDLTGLEAAINLDDLRLNDNLISDISPLAGLMRLRHIELNRNAIRDLSPITGLINLNHLHISHNLISDLSPVEELINLHAIGISDNIISDLSPLADLIKLNSIWMSQNPPADLSPLTGLTNLTYFHSWGTPILDLAPLAKLPKLRTLDICGGEISDLSALEGLTSLKELYLVGNEITDISPVASLTGLTRLNISENQILDASPLAGLTNLTWIGITHNPISDLSPLEELSIPILHHNTSVFPTGGPIIEGPWLWVLVPGNRVGDGDLLAQASNGAITEEKVATVGASDGKLVGENEWTADNIEPTGNNNIGEMLKRQGVGTNGVVYGSATLQSPQEQETRMFSGHRDGVKIYLNGELVHQQRNGHWGEGYHRFFPVTLNEGTNVLLVALDNRHVNEWKGFFGFDTDTKYTVNPPISRSASETPAYDVNEDGQINVLDLILVGQDMGKANPTNTRTDVNGDGKRNISDIILVARHLGEITGIPTAPAALAQVSMKLDPAVIRTWIAQAQVANDGSLTFQQGISNLQRLLRLLAPERTALLANYPNPFNPETWIPYQLATAADVQIRIYATNGALVRTLDMGHQPAGIYQQRSRAAYWDGRNQLGEQVASGVYFYTFTAGAFTATGKMLVKK